MFARLHAELDVENLKKLKSKPQDGPTDLQKSFSTAQNWISRAPKWTSKGPSESLLNSKISPDLSKVDFLGLNMDTLPPKMSPGMAFKPNLNKLALDCHMLTSQIGGGGGDPRRDCQ